MYFCCVHGWGELSFLPLCHLDLPPLVLSIFYLRFVSFWHWPWIWNTLCILFIVIRLYEPKKGLHVGREEVCVRHGDESPRSPLKSLRVLSIHSLHLKAVSDFASADLFGPSPPSDWWSVPFQLSSEELWLCFHWIPLRLPYLCPATPLFLLCNLIFLFFPQMLISNKYFICQTLCQYLLFRELNL